MSANGRTRPEDLHVAASFSDLAHDVIELTELQAELFALDVKDTSKSARAGLMLAVGGLVVLLGSVPVALVTLAFMLIEKGGWSQSAAFSTATLVGILVAAGILAGAWMRFRTSAVTMHRSRDELKRNIAWVKSSLRNRSQTNPMEDV